MVRDMKKHLKLIRNENGQMLLFVLISASMIIVLFVGAIKLYMNTIEESRFLLEQVEIETIVQMSKRDLLTLKGKDKELKTSYHFTYPNGDIYLTLAKLEDKKYLMNNEIVLKNKSTYENTLEVELK